MCALYFTLVFVNSVFDSKSHWLFAFVIKLVVAKKRANGIFSLFSYIYLLIDNKLTMEIK